MGENETPAGLTVAEGGTLTDGQKEFINKNWRGAVDPEHASHASMADYSDLGGLTKSYINQQKLIGSDKLPLPQKDWKTEDWKSFNQKIGMPAEAKDYKLTAHEGISEADIDWFRNAVHENMLSERQASKLWDSMSTRNAGAREEFTNKNKTRLEDGYKALREEWGTNYDAMVKGTNKGLQRLDGDGRFRKFMKDSGLNKEPEMLRFANKIAQLFNEDKAPGDTRVPVPMNAQQAEAQIRKMHSDAQKDPKSHPLYNKKDPAHQDAVDKLTKLATLAGKAGV